MSSLEKNADKDNSFQRERTEHKRMDKEFGKIFSIKTKKDIPKESFGKVHF